MVGSGVLLTGRWHPELEGALLETLRDDRKRNPVSPLVIAVGSLTLSRHLRNEIARGVGSTAGIRIDLLNDIAGRLAARDVAARGLLPFPGLAAAPLVDELCRAHGTLAYFSGVSGKHGFARALASTFEDLRESGIGPGSLPPAFRNPKLDEVFSLYRRYLEKKRGCHDPNEMYERAAASAHLFEALFGSRELFLYGFYDFTEVQRRFIEALIGTTHTVVFFPHLESAHYEYAEKTLSWLRSTGLRERKLPLAEKKLVVRGVGGARESGRKDSAPGAGVGRGAVSLRVMSAAGRWREAREIARCLLAHSEEGIPFHRMAVFIRDPGSYLDLLLESFDEAGIPCDLGIGPPLSRTRAGKSLLLLLELLSSDLPRPLVATFLSTAPIDYESLFGIPLESPMLLDLVSREVGIVKGEEEWREKLALGLRRLDALLAAERGERDQEVMPRGKPLHPATLDAVRILLLLVERLGELKRHLEEMDSWQGLTGFCDGLLTGFFAPLDETDLLRKALRKLQSLDGIVPAPTPASARRVLAELLDASSRRGGAGSGRGVLVTDLMGARGVSADVVVVPGLIEGGFPGRIRQDPILLDNERESLRASLGAGRRSESRTKSGPASGAHPFALPPKWIRVREERLLFHLAAGSARKHLILSYPRIDPRTAKPFLPSYLLLQFLEEATGEKVTIDGLDRLAVIEKTPLASVAPRGERVLLSSAEYDLCETSRAIEERKPSRIRYLLSLSACFGRSLIRHRARWTRGAFTPFDGVLEPERLSPRAREALELSGRVVAAARLEKYAACPFAYFVEEVLGLSPLEEPEEEITLTNMKRGSLYHSVLEKIVPRITELHESRRTFDEIMRVAMSLQEKSFAVFESSETTGAPLVWEIEKEAVREDVAAYLAGLAAELADWKPHLFERAFGREGIECLRYATAGGERLLLRGRIDRVDVSRKGKGYRVVDYKTGKMTAKDNDFAQGESLQLAFYLLACAHVFSLGKVEEGTASYHHVTRRGGYGRVGLAGNQWETLRPVFDLILETITRGIREGLFPSFPGSERGRCRYCEAVSMCPSNAGRVFERKKEDPRLSAFLAMKTREEEK